MIEVATDWRIQWPGTRVITIVFHVAIDNKTRPCGRPTDVRGVNRCATRKALSVLRGFRTEVPGHLAGLMQVMGYRIVRRTDWTAALIMDVHVTVRIDANTWVRTPWARCSGLPADGHLADWYYRSLR